MKMLPIFIYGKYVYGVELFLPRAIQELDPVKLIDLSYFQARSSIPLLSPFHSDGVPKENTQSEGIFQGSNVCSI